MPKPIDKLSFWKDRIDTAVSDHYSVYVVHEAGWKKINETHEKIIKKHIPEGVMVLDAGCGYGRMCKYFAPEDYVGVDFSPDFIKKAQDKFPAYAFRVENLKELSFDDGQFAWAIVVSIKKMVVDNLGQEAWNEMEKEIKRVSKKVLLLEYEEPEKYEVL